MQLTAAAAGQVRSRLTPVSPAAGDAARGAPPRAPCNPASSEHLIPPGLLRTMSCTGPIAICNPLVRSEQLPVLASVLTVDSQLPSNRTALVSPARASGFPA